MENKNSNCVHLNTHYGDYSVEGSEIHISLNCEDCGYKWREVYIFSHRLEAEKTKENTGLVAVSHTDPDVDEKLENMQF